MKTELNLVDELGTIKAQIAELKAKEALLAEGVKKLILKGGSNAAEGILFRATLSATVRASIDTKRLREEQAEIALQYTVEAPVETLRVCARKGV